MSRRTAAFWTTQAMQFFKNVLFTILIFVLSLTWHRWACQTVDPIQWKRQNSQNKYFGKSKLIRPVFFQISLYFWNLLVGIVSDSFYSNLYWPKIFEKLFKLQFKFSNLRKSSIFKKSVFKQCKFKNHHPLKHNPITLYMNRFTKNPMYCKISYSGDGVKSNICLVYSLVLLKAKL